MKKVFQYHIYTIEFPDIGGSAQHGVRPAICVSNNTNNIFSDTAQFVPLTSKIKRCLPTHAVLYKSRYPCLNEDSIALVEQITTLPTESVIKFIGKLSQSDSQELTECILKQFDISR